jgi:hypothetical protein
MGDKREVDYYMLLGVGRDVRILGCIGSFGVPNKRSFAGERA